MVCKCYHADKNFLGEIGVCWGTKECESCSCGGDEAKCDFYDYVRERVKKPITNADRIRAMTDEELAELLTAVAQESAHKLCESLKTVEVDLSNCNFHILYEAHLDWLKQEVESDG